MTEAELLERLKQNQDAAVHALKRNDMVAYEALARDEARLMDALKAIWHGDKS